MCRRQSHRVVWAANIAGAFLCWALGGFFWWRGSVGDPEGLLDWFLASFCLCLAIQFLRNSARLLTRGK